MQHVIEEYSTQEYGHEVPSHGWPTWNTKKEVQRKGKIVIQMDVPSGSNISVSEYTYRKKK